MSEPGALEEIPATKIETFNCEFSPIKFTETGHEIDEKNGGVGSIVDEEITFGMMARKRESSNVCNDNSDNSIIATEAVNASVTADNTIPTATAESITNNTLLEERLQRKSDDDICNTPKRERHEDQNMNIRSTRLLEMDNTVNDEDEENVLMKTPMKKGGEMVKSLSIEFEQRLASIHVSPRPAPNTNMIGNNNMNSAQSSVNNSGSKPVRSMSPIRSIAQLSPVSKLNLNDDSTTNIDDNFIEIETPKLVSPSKIVAAASAIDIEKIKSEVDAKWSKQVEFLQFEVSTLQEKYESSIKGNAEMRTMLAEYEKTLAQFIDARRTRPDQHSSIDQLVQDKKKLELEIQTIQISYQNLHQRYEDMKGLQEQSRINDATLRQSIQVLQQELASTVRTLENTRRAYEDKIEKINAEAKNTKEALENELSATKAKLLKSELKISSLESAIETKTKENSELMTICDELIHKMDKRCT